MPATQPFAARRRRLLPVLVLLGLCQLSFSQQAQAWWNSDWSNRMKIDADTTPKGANITTPIGRTQILIRLHSGNFNFATAKDDGADIRVVAGDDRTPLHFSIEKFDGLVDQVGLIWVDVTDLAPAASTSLYVYWGNKNATNGSDSKATYGAEQVLVYHFADDNGVPHDSTSYANNALTGGKRVDGGMIGSGLRLDGKAPVQLPKSPSLAFPAGQPATYSLWVHPDDTIGSGVVYDTRDGANELTIGIDNRVAYAQLTTAAGVQRTSAGPAMAATGWHLIGVTASDHLTVFVDGQKVGDVAVSLPALTGQAALGGLLPAPAAPAPADATAPPPPTPVPPTPVTAANFVGIIDEFHIVKAVVTAGAMQLAVHGEGPSPNLLVLETPEQSSPFGTGYIGIILGSVTPDAWFVIGVLMVMSVISWAVMVAKGIYVGNTNKANAAFRVAYRARASHANGDLLAAMRSLNTDNAANLKRSTLLRLNGVATTEIDDRLNGGRVDANGMLASQSIAAIRSALDGQLAVEIQKLNRLMVLLTIAIAGGPFIGLLGTVIGVMITFAAIAQAGDVNVNAIAPGISAALLATVAGLLVAIPALFGYNYFNTRIGDAISEMNVFVDTLVTRMGEGLLGRRPQITAGE